MRYAKSYNKNEYGKYLESLPLHLLLAEWDYVTSLFRALKQVPSEPDETENTDTNLEGTNEGIE